MSARKNIEKKILEDENIDSGFLSGTLSGPLSEQFSEQSSSDLLQPSSDSDEKKVLSESLVEEELDSGVICLSKDLASINLTEYTPPSQCAPEITVNDPQNADIPPLHILFQQDEDGDTQLHIAAVHGCEKSVGTLIRLCPDKAWLDIPNDFRHTALHLAVLARHAHVARMLVISGASLEARDLAGQTPLHLATQLGSVACLHALLTPVSHNAPVDSVINEMNYDGQTCVHIAAETGNVEVMQTLIYYKADLNAKEGLAGRTALHMAARRGHAPLVRLVASAGGARLARIRDYSGRTAQAALRHAQLHHLLPRTVLTDDDSDSDSDHRHDEEDSDNEALFDALVSMRRSANTMMQAV